MRSTFNHLYVDDYMKIIVCIYIVYKYVNIYIYYTSVYIIDKQLNFTFKYLQVYTRAQQYIFVYLYINVIDRLAFHLWSVSLL